MTLKDDSDPIQAELKAAVKHAVARGDTRGAGHLGDILGMYRKGQLGDCASRNAASAEMKRT